MTAIYNPRDSEPAHIRKHNEKPNVIKVYPDEWDSERGKFLRNVRLICSDFPGVYTPHWRWTGEGDRPVPDGVRTCRFAECINPRCYK